MVKINTLEQRENGIILWEMKNEFIRLIVANLGGHVLSIFTKDKHGVEDDVVLGFQNVEDCAHDGTYMGAVVGRVANRLKNASFSLNGVEYPLAANAGTNHLHGGICGFNQKIFSHEILENGIKFSYLSEDMEEGYPGNLTLEVTYTLEDHDFVINYQAACDKDTLCNLTNHSYFNLSGLKHKIYGHKLKIKADTIAALGSDFCPNGSFPSVKDTPFDFHEFHEIGERIHEKDEQLIIANGYDHAFLFQPEAKEDQIVLWEEESGRKLTISTTMPCAQIYTGNFLEGSCPGKHGASYQNRDGVAIETQFLPDSIHVEKDSPTILRKGETLHSQTRYRFEVE